MKPLTFLRTIIACVVSALHDGMALKAQVASTTVSQPVTISTFTATMPPKPEGLTNPPLIKLSVEASAAPDLRDSLALHVSGLLFEAHRPRITESDKAVLTLKVILESAPSIDITKANGWGVIGRKIPSLIPGVSGTLKNISEAIEFDKTNVQAVVRCGIAIQIKDPSGEIIGQSSVMLEQTNNLRAIGVQLAGMVNGEQVADVTQKFKNVLTASEAKKRIAYAAARGALAHIYPRLDEELVKRQTPTIPSVTSSPSIQPADPIAQEWLTPKEAAMVLRVTEQDVIDAIEKGEIKAKKIGGQYRIRRSELK